MSVEHDVNAPGVIHEAIRTESHRLWCFSHMREQDHIVGTFSACGIDCLLHQCVERLGLQVVEQDAVGVVERIAFEDHRLRCAGTYIGYLLVTVLVDNVRRIHGFWLSCLVEIDAGHRGTRILQQLPHARHTVVKLMVAQCQRMIVHEAQDVCDVLSLRDGASGIALQEVTTADGSCIGSIRAVNGVAQSCHLRVAVDSAMRIVLIENHDALLSCCYLAAHRQGYQAKKYSSVHSGLYDYFISYEDTSEGLMPNSSLKHLVK